MAICLSATVAISAIIVAFNHKATGSNGVIMEICSLTTRFRRWPLSVDLT